MGFQLQQEENYNLVRLKADAFDAAQHSRMNEEVGKAMKDNPYLIVNCKSLKDLGAKETDTFKNWHAIAKKLGGSVLATEIPDKYADKIEKIGIHCIPTDEEAVDFLFMDQLEKEFHEDDDDDDF